MNFIKKLFGFSLGPLIGSILSFITIPITTYFINPMEYGKSSMFLTIQVLLVSIIFLGYDQSFSREYHNYSNKKKLFQNAVIIPLSFSILNILIFIIFRSKISMYLFGNKNYWLISVSLGVLLFFTVIERFVLMKLRMDENAILYSFYSVIVKFLILCMTVIFLLNGNRDFLVIINSTIYGQLIFDIFLLIKYRSLFNFKNFEFDRELCINMSKFGFPLMLSIFLSSFLNTSGRFYLGRYSTYYELGIFTAAMKVSGLLLIIQASFTSFWLPTAYRWEKEKVNIKQFKLVSNGLCLFLTIVLMVIILLKDWVVIFISPEYIEAKFILPLMCLPPLLFTLSETTTLGIVFSRKSYLNIIVGGISLIPTIFLCNALIPQYGTRGASIAQAIGFIFFYFSRSIFSKLCHYSISTIKQNIIVIIMFFISCVNLFDSPKVLFVNIVTSFILIIIQIPIILELRKYSKN